jgi:hypothetical protein
MSTILGAFETRDGATRAVDSLIAEGFEPDDISVLGPRGELATVTPENETARNVATGAGIGAAIGGLGSILIGAAALAIPGVGPIIAIGALAAPLTAAIGGGLIGGLIGFLTSRGVPEEEASYYAERVKAGAFVVAVEVDPAEESRARRVLMNSGAEGPIREREAA